MEAASGCTHENYLKQVYQSIWLWLVTLVLELFLFTNRQLLHTMDYLISVDTF